MKKFFKICEKIFKTFWVQLIALILFALAVLALGGAFASGENAKNKILEFITGTDMLSIFLAAAFSLIVAKIALKIKHTMEESLKLEDDHHKIISKYYKHTVPDPTKETNGNVFSPDGIFMQLKRVPHDRKRPRNMVVDTYSEEYARRENDINEYMDGRLFLSGLNVYANVNGDTSMVFADSKEMSELPSFIREHATELLKAHGGSSIRNTVTVRLQDVESDGKRLTLKTQRSQYFYMLVTNRCMDYKLDGNITIRDIYEFKDKVSPLPESRLGNQLGINGLVFTTDGYVLIEKRGKRKTTWKDKFAQPISLALKEKAFSSCKTPGASGTAAALQEIILDTLSKNYGIEARCLKPFSVENNFLGLARDLIEGGKPNMYFYVIADMTAAELKDKLQKKAADAAKKAEKDDLPAIFGAKLDSDLYLVPLDDIAINFGYELKLDPRRIIYVRRRFAPRVTRLRQRFDGTAYRVRRALGMPFEKECGEALLACLYYADLCSERIEKELKMSEATEATV